MLIRGRREKVPQLQINQESGIPLCDLYLGGTKWVHEAGKGNVIMISQAPDFS